MTTTVAYDPFSPAVQVDPFPFYAALRRDAPVQHISSLDGYAISRHEDVRRVMHDHVTFSSEAMAALVSRPVEIGNQAGVFDEPTERSVSIIGIDGDDHTRLRKIVNRGFTPARIALLEQEMRATAGTLIERLVAKEAADLQAVFAIPYPTIVIAQMLGVDPDHRDDFRRWSEDMVLAVFEPTTTVQQARIATSGDEMGVWLDDVIEARAGTDGEDLISVLLRAELEGGALTNEEMRVFVFTLLVAGSITTAYLIGNAVMSLVEDAALCDRVRSELTLVRAVVEESLRHDSPVQMMFRTATTDVELAGVCIPRGATVVPLIGAANRDESAFPDPDVFDIDRPGSDHLAFGHGPHFCLGAALARLEARVAIEELLTRAPRLDAIGPLERASSLVFRGPSHLQLRFS